ncbi:hypothetical protein EPN18_02120 [bacterium]|nr:MAG: hypothetical protein EPN18_02120 [bacterium]
MFNKKNTLIAGFFLLLSMGYFYSVLDGSAILNERDLAVFFIPPKILWLNILKGGEFPLWNPYFYSGHPLFATLQPGVLYPPNVFFLLLPFDLAYNWTIIIHFPLSGFFTYLLLRDLKASVAGAVMGALTFLLGGYLFSVHNVISTLFSVAWAPLVIFLFLRAIKFSSFFYSALTGIFLTVMFLGGGIETLYGTFVVLAFLCVFPAVFDFTGHGGAQAPFKTRALLLVTAGVLFILLSAIQLLPFMEVARMSTRSGGLSFFEATTWSFDMKDVVQFFISDPYGYLTSDTKYWANQSWLKSIYTGWVPFILSAVFFIDKKRRSLAFTLLSLIALSFALGRNNSFYQFFYNFMPFLSKMRYPVKFIFIFFILLAVSTAFGYDSLVEKLEEKNSAIKKFCIILLALATACAIGFALLHYYSAEATAYLARNGVDFPEYNYARINIFNTKRTIFFFIAASLVIYACFRSARLRKALPYLLCGVLTIDLFFAHYGYYGYSLSRDYHRPGNVMDFVKKDKGLFRVFITPKTKNEPMEVSGDDAFDKAVISAIDISKERLMGYNLEHGVFDIDGVDVIRRTDYMELHNLIFAQKSIDSSNLLQLFNVKYVVSIPVVESKEFKLLKIIGAKSSDLIELEDTKSLKIYENLHFLPRFYAVDRYMISKDRSERLLALALKSFDPSTMVVLEEDPWAGNQPKDLSAGTPRGDVITVKNYRNNSVELMVNMPRSGIFVASESYYPGWKAFVDGKEKKILKANHALRALALEKGEHTIKFVYSPLSFTIGAVISVLTLLALIVAGVFYLVWKKAGKDNSRLRSR